MILLTAFEVLVVALMIIALIYWLPYITMGICILLAIGAVVMGRKERRRG